MIILHWRFPCQAWVHPRHEYPDVLETMSTPLILRVGFGSEVLISAHKINTTDDYDALSREQRNCILKGKKMKEHEEGLLRGMK